ncbi:HTTM domain-containing protein [Archangium primigenium]|uniref:HTTM domain-containing protein n=1 Tax=[Archangium] primigenium TaxID=2792470 RepID=UPI00195D30B9|nr:HTTM domain-containing protein [Archangium primigenium]
MSAWRQRLSEPVDAAFLVALRIFLGAVLTVAVVRYFVHGWIGAYYVAPPILFPFHGFGWLRPLPGGGMYALFAVLGVLAVGLMVGAWPRACAALFGGLFAYVQLLDRAHYLNHYYLVCLLCGLLALMPLSAGASLTARHRPGRLRDTVPAWTLYTLRAQFLVVYFFSGLAKWQPDWLVRHQPMLMWLSTSAGARRLEPLVSVETLAALSSWGGAAIVLLAPPLLLLERVRPYAYAALVAFHVLSGALLPLGIFPWLMVLALLLFFEPGWPRRWWPGITSGQGSGAPALAPRWLLAVLGVHFLVQWLLPLRHWLYPGDVLWNEEGFRFSWHLKIREKHGHIRFFATDPRTGARWELRPEGLLSDKQAGRMLTQPDLILAFAHVLAERTGIPGVQVRADARVSLNGRPYQPLVDPQVDLAAERDGFAPKPWILPAPR